MQWPADDPYRAALGMHRLWPGLTALALLATVYALFAHSPLRERVLWQLESLTHLRSAWLARHLPRESVVSAGATRREESRAAVHADLPSGFYDRPMKAALMQASADPIYYTLGNSDKPLRYVEPLAIDRTTVLRFAAKPSDLVVGDFEARTYLIRETGSLPVLSITFNPAFLWNLHTGIYRNYLRRGRAWERPARAEYLSAGDSAPPAMPIELAIHGNGSRSHEKKSFQLMDPSARPNDRLLHGGSPTTGDNGTRTTVIARAAGVDASYRLGDELFRSVYGAAGGKIAPSTAVQLLLNGTPWGLYQLYPKIDQAFLEGRFGPGKYDIIRDPAYENPPKDSGWKQLEAFFTNQNLAEDGAWEKIAKMIDVTDFTDYWLFNIYAGNMDWPHNNFYAFRNRSGDGRWRWMSWDTDGAFDGQKGVGHDTLAWATRGVVRHDLSYGGRFYDEERWLASTLMIRGLLKNPIYRARFFERFCELKNRYFSPALLQARFNRVLENIRPHLKADWARWSGSEAAYHRAVEQVRRFIDERPQVILSHFRKHQRADLCPAQ